MLFKRISTRKVGVRFLFKIYCIRIWTIIYYFVYFLMFTFILVGRRVIIPYEIRIKELDSFLLRVKVCIC